jgi:hypothetical protein
MGESGNPVLTTVQTISRTISRKALERISSVARRNMSNVWRRHARVRFVVFTEPPVGIGHAKPGPSGCYATLPRARCPSFLRLILYRAGSAGPLGGMRVNKHRDRYYQSRGRRERECTPSSHGQPAVLAFFCLEKACEEGEGRSICG